MNISTFDACQSQAVINLYTNVFSDSEGRDGGASIGHLVSDLIATTDERDIVGFVAALDDAIIGCIFFSRLFLTSEKTRLFFPLLRSPLSNKEKASVNN